MSDGKLSLLAIAINPHSYPFSSQIGQRRTLITDVITPRMRRGAGGFGGGGDYSRNGGGSGNISRRSKRSSSPPGRRAFITPINMSYPSPSTALNTARSAPGTSRSSGGAGGGGGGGMLQKLRKQFLNGR